MASKKASWPTIVLMAVYALALAKFFFIYVPLVGPFQAVLAPLLALTAVLTAAAPLWGAAVFCFLFPLVNSLPYFFKIFESTPHAPTALVLFLFFFLGWLIRRCFDRTELPDRPGILKPMALFALLVSVSAAITIFRFANFTPFLSDAIYELVTNVVQLTAGGAIMSAVFYALNYLSEMAFLFILLHLVSSFKNLRLLWTALFSGTAATIGVGLYQRLGHIDFGNTPLRVSMGTLNATFKDPNSFGAFLGMMLPLMLGILFLRKPAAKVFSGTILVAGLFLLPFTGSGSGFLGILAALLAFFLMYLDQIRKNRTAGPAHRRKLIRLAAVVLGCVLLLTASLMISKDSKLFYKLKLKVIDLQKKSSLDNLIHKRWADNWESAVVMMRDYPLTGVGIGAYTVEISNYAETLKKSWPIGESAENYLLQAGSELGLPGVILVLWIFWELIRQMRRAYRANPWPGRWRFVQLATIAGLISYFVNIQFHTYIGSYEMKYVFWLLAISVFVQPGPDDTPAPEGPPRKAGLSKRARAWTVVLVVLLASIHLWNSAHSLSLKSRTERFHLKQDFGLYPAEKDNEGREFRWTRNYGGLTLKIEKPILVLPLHASHPDIHKKPITIRLYFVKDLFRQKRLVKEITLARNEWQDVVLAVPEEVGQDVILLIKIDRTWNPLKTTGVPDPRDLGIAVGNITFQDR